RSAVSAANGKPNILVILTDDQDDHMQSLEYMPYLYELVQKKGRAYTNRFCTVALYCPSRVNLWTGRAAHNTNITDIFHPCGGYPRIVEQGIDKNMLPHWLQEAGYSTYYTGKMWNMHTIQNYNSPPQSGYDGSAFILDPFT
ncbi:Arylsulphatase, partial [Penicillium malachiteum]